MFLDQSFVLCVTQESGVRCPLSSDPPMSVPMTARRADPAAQPFTTPSPPSRLWAPGPESPTHFLLPPVTCLADLLCWWILRRPISDRALPHALQKTSMHQEAKKSLGRPFCAPRLQPITVDQISSVQSRFHTTAMLPLNPGNEPSITLQRTVFRELDTHKLTGRCVGLIHRPGR